MDVAMMTNNRSYSRLRRGRKWDVGWRCSLGKGLDARLMSVDVVMRDVCVSRGFVCVFALNITQNYGPCARARNKCPLAIHRYSMRGQKMNSNVKRDSFLFITTMTMTTKITHNAICTTRQNILCSHSKSFLLTSTR